MKETLTNVVLRCDSNKEAEEVSRILDRRGYQFNEIFDDVVEIYEERTPQQWADLIKDIKADLHKRSVAEKLTAMQTIQMRANNLQAEVDRLRAEVDRLRAEVEK